MTKKSYSEFPDNSFPILSLYFFSQPIARRADGSRNDSFGDADDGHSDCVEKCFRTNRTAMHTIYAFRAEKENARSEAVFVSNRALSSKGDILFCKRGRNRL